MKTLLSEWIKRVSGHDNLRLKTHKTLSQTSLYQGDTKLLAAEGVGTICLKLAKPKAFNLDLIASNALLRLSVNQHSVKLYCIYRGRFILLNEEYADGIGLDSDPECLYWLSFKAKTRTILFGKRHPTIHHASFFFTLPKSNKSPQQFWMNKIAHYRIDTPAVTYLSNAFVSTEFVPERGFYADWIDPHCTKQFNGSTQSS